jgi:hypothetical protein
MFFLSGWKNNIFQLQWPTTVADSAITFFLTKDAKKSGVNSHRFVKFLTNIYYHQGFLF